MDRPAAQAPTDARGRRSAFRADLDTLLKLSGPVVLSRLGIMVMGLCDTVVVGRYSAEQLGYHALAWAPTSVILTFAIGLLTGVQVMTARRIGEGRRDLTGAVLRRGLVYSGWIGLASMIGLILIGPPFLHVIGLQPDLADGASRVLIIFAFSLPFYGLAITASAWLEGQSRPGPGAWAMWAANVVNLALLLLLVPGSFGLPALGAVGGAWATTGARAFLVIAMLTYVARMPEARALGVFRKPERDRPAEQIHHGGCRAATRRVGRRLVVEGVEVIVGVAAVLGRVAVEAGQGSVEDRQLLPGVVADHPDVQANPRGVRRQGQRDERHEAHLARIELVDPEVMHRIPVDRAQRDLLVVEEGGAGVDGPRMHHVTVRQDQAARRVDDEACAVRGACVLGVEVAGGGHLDRHDRLGDGVEGGLPGGLRSGGGQGGDQDDEEGEHRHSEAPALAG